MYMTEAQAKKMRKYYRMDPVKPRNDTPYAGLIDERTLPRASSKDGLAPVREMMFMVWAERFGKVPKTAIARINKADEATLRRAGYRLVMGDPARDIFK
ncbi:MAG: hypothetical protein Q8N26_36910 [Myxococcales bacterium]|nr:hypothetical protein [Myxococcales bacterium]